LKSNRIIKEEFLIDLLETEDYKNVFDVKLLEFDNIAQYLEHPSVSTQHGVKGEGHDTIIFVADDSPTLDVTMYEFLKVISNVNINLTDFQNFYFSLKQRLEGFVGDIGFKLEKINKQQLEEHKNLIVEQLKLINSDFSGDLYYEELIADEIRNAIAKPLVGKVKKIKTSKIFRVLNSYRLFYVGCSRARRKLTVILEKTKLDGFRSSLINRMTGFGFIVEEK
jgi:DNA helicase-2/ATP-dependent DNA helicase PcrA